MKIREWHIAAHEELSGKENESDGETGKRKDRTACKGHTAQFTSVKETIWLQLLLLSHSEPLNSLFLHVEHVHVCTCVCLYLCLCEYVHVDKCVDMLVFISACVFGSLAACAPDAQGCYCVATY